MGKRMEGLRAVKSEDGRILATVPEMDHEITAFWKRVVSPTPASVPSFVNALRQWMGEVGLRPAPRMPACPFDADEIRDAILRMRVNSAPGPGGWFLLKLRVCPCLGFRS